MADERRSYDSDIAVILSDISNIKGNAAETKTTMGKIFTTLEGKNGMVARLAVLESQQKDAPTRNWRLSE